jgi:putative MFS transporter
LSAAGWGGAVGLFILGPLVDKVGRKRMFQWSILSYAVVSLLTIFIHQPITLIVLRFVGGAGMGVMLPVDITIISEFMPKLTRGRIQAAVNLTWMAGALLAGLAALLLLPIAWQWPFVIGLFPILLFWAIGRWVPESPRWLLRKGRVHDAETVVREVTGYRGEFLAVKPETGSMGRIGELWEKKYRQRTIMVWGYFIFGQFAYFGYLFWMPTLFVILHGTTLFNGLVFSMLIVIGGLIGRFSGTLLVDRIGRKRLFVGGWLVAAIVSLLFALVHAVPTLVVLGMLIAFFNENAQIALAVYTPEQYPTEIRALGTSYGMMLAKVGAGLGPLIIGGLLALHRVALGFEIIAACFFVGALFIVFLGHETKNESMEVASDDPLIAEVLS